MSETLFDLPPAPRSAPARTTSKGIAPGDVVEVDKKGRHFHALVKEIHQDPKGYYQLDVLPFDRRVSYRHATVREITAVWRRVRTGRAAAPEA